MFAGSLVFARSIIVSISDMQKDQILGRESLPILIGRNKSQFLMCSFLALALAFNSALACQAFGGGAMHVKVMAILATCALYPILYQWIYKVRFSAGRPRIDPGAEPAFFLAGLLALWN
jgi:4-hydroxy-3-methylbut-2-enyl diphosphate reductase